MQKRKRSDPNRASWVEQLLVIKTTVEAMPHGSDREDARQRALQLEAAIGIDGWLRPTNRTRVLNGNTTPATMKSGYRFIAVGDRSVGWSIRAISADGQEECLVSVYTSRSAAQRDLARITSTWLPNGAPDCATSASNERSTAAAFLASSRTAHQSRNAQGVAQNSSSRTPRVLAAKP